MRTPRLFTLEAIRNEVATCAIQRGDRRSTTPASPGHFVRRTVIVLDDDDESQHHPRRERRSTTESFDEVEEVLGEVIYVDSGDEEEEEEGEEGDREDGHDEAEDDLIITGSSDLTDSSHAGEISEHVLQLDPGSDVQLKDGTILRILKAWINASGEHLIKGRLLKHQDQDALMPSANSNHELVWKSEYDNSTNTAVRKYVTRFANEALCNCKVIFTNTGYDELNYHILRSTLTPVFFCRWKRVTAFDPKYPHKHGRIERLSEAETDGEELSALLDTNILHETGASACVSGKMLREVWRGSTSLLGEDITTQKWIGLDGLEDDEKSTRRYTFGDAFCGAGGTSQGAREAGLSLRWSFDFDEKAVETFALNLGDTGVTALHKTVADFIEDVQQHQHSTAASPLRVDILHISPPCQPYSPANTTPNRDKDVLNYAAFLSIGMLIKTVKPRVVTLEETHGLVYRRHRAWFRMMVEMFVENGYSLHWHIVPCANYGVPQTRERLLIIAAGPGEKLPNLAPPTHRSPKADSLSLFPMVTIQSTLAAIPPDATDHVETATHYSVGRWRPEHNRQLAGTITCGGGAENYHPSGRRGYSIREFACLQTFPIRWVFPTGPGFGKTVLVRVIGNAVPPRMARSIYEQIVVDLKKNDLEELSNEDEDAGWFA